MNNNLEHFDIRVFEKLLDFVYPDERQMTKRDVQKELQQLNIDMRPVKQKLQLALNSYRQTQEAKHELATARETRLSLLERIKNVTIPDLPSVRSELQELISQRMSGSLQAAYFRKLEDAATEQDLKTLLQDIFLLESLDKETNGEEE